MALRYGTTSWRGISASTSPLSVDEFWISFCLWSKEKKNAQFERRKDVDVNAVALAKVSYFLFLAVFFFLID